MNASIHPDPSPSSDRLKIEQRSRAYWRVTLDNPPINLFDPEMASALQALTAKLEADDQVKVVVFDSANPDYFMAHLDLERTAALDLTPGPTGLSPWPDVALRLGRAPFVTIGVVRGRARGVGSEFLLAMDLSFASRERAVLCQIEVAMGLLPGGGGSERLPLLTGRTRAMEIILGSQDFDADTAERYGWVNRSIPDADLDAFVEAFASRVASFDRGALAAAKQIINQRAGLPTVADLEATQATFFELAQGASSQSRVQRLFGRGLQRAADLELQLGHHLGQQ